MEFIKFFIKLLLLIYSNKLKHHSHWMTIFLITIVDILCNAHNYNPYAKEYI